ncbi:MAG: hypothetical protein NZ518_12390, partial [Dehalococcoidia bacterium]|nr:hypothetical protein [Dehalococcoidia bacterium]
MGAAIAVRLGGPGSRIAVHYHGSRAGAEETVARIEARGGDGFALRADLRDRREARALAALAGLPGVPRLLRCRRDRLEREYLPGRPMTEVGPRDPG